MAFGTLPDTSYREGPLHTAAYHGDLSAVKALVKQGAEVNEIGKISGNTPLHWAVNSGRVNIASFNPATGIPNFPKPDEKRLLNYIEIVRFLVQHGADVNIKDKSGETVLYQAVSEGKTAMAEILIEQGRADVNVKNNWFQNTPLHVVKDPKTAKLLISAGADVHARNKWEDTPLHEARGAEITRLFIGAGAKVNARNTSGATPLHFVDDFPSAKLQVSAGADIHAGTKGANTFKIKFGKERIYYQKEKETETKAKEKARYLGRTPLHYVINAPEVMKYLIGIGADVNAKDNNGATPLHSASFDIVKEYLKSVKILVQARADVNAKDKNGLTPLHLASHRGYVKTMEYLMENGADVHARDKEGRVPLHVMFYNIRWKIMLSPIGEVDKVIQNKQSDALRIYELFQQKGLDTNVRDNKGRSPLHYMMKDRDNLWLAKTFIQYAGTDVNVKDNDEKTPFHDLMIFYGHFVNPDIIQAFVSAGANINARDHEGKTPLHYAVTGRNEDIVKTLIKAGANKSIQDNTGKIPADYASDDGMKRVLQP